MQEALAHRLLSTQSLSCKVLMMQGKDLLGYSAHSLTGDASASANLAAKKWGCSTARTCSQQCCWDLQQPRNKGIRLQASKARGHGATPCLAHWQLSTHNCRSLILLTRNLMAGCALVLNSACWSSGSCFSTLSNQGCTESKPRQLLPQDELMPSKVGHKQAAVAELHNITTVKFEAWLTLM